MKTTIVKFSIARSSPAGGTSFRTCEVRILSTDDGEEIGMVAEHLSLVGVRTLEPLTDREKSHVRKLASMAPKPD